MNDITFFNASRQSRTEARISEVQKYCKSPRYREEVIKHFSKQWGVGETTISYIMQAAMRERKLQYYDGKYRA